MANLAAQIMALNNAFARPAQLSGAQQGLMNTLGQSFTSTPALDTNSISSMTAAMQKAIQEGDIQKATFLRQQIAQVQGQRDSLGVTPVAGMEKNQMLARQAQRRQAEMQEQRKKEEAKQAAAKEVASYPALADDLRMAGENGLARLVQTYHAQGKPIPAGVATEIATRMGLPKANEAVSPSGKVTQDLTGLKPGDPGFEEAMLTVMSDEAERDAAKRRKSPDPITPRDILESVPESDRMQTAMMARDQLANMQNGRAGDDSALRRTLTSLYPQDLKSTAALQEFANNKSLPRRIKDSLLMWGSGDLSAATIADYGSMIEAAIMFEQGVRADGIAREINLSFDEMSSKDIQRTGNASGAQVYQDGDVYYFVYPEVDGSYINPGDFDSIEDFKNHYSVRKIEGY